MEAKTKSITHTTTTVVEGEESISGFAGAKSLY